MSKYQSRTGSRDAMLVLTMRLSSREGAPLKQNIHALVQSFLETVSDKPRRVQYCLTAFQVTALAAPISAREPCCPEPRRRPAPCCVLSQLTARAGWYGRRCQLCAKRDLCWPRSSGPSRRACNISEVWCLGLRRFEAVDGHSRVPTLLPYAPRP